MKNKAQKLLTICIKNNLKISLAESCTGGMVSSEIVSIPSASSVFQYGLITYSNEAKRKLLQVPRSILIKHGAVSKQTAETMVQRLFYLSKADFCIAITGIAGPSGGTKNKPVGLVYHSFLLKNRNPIVKKKIYLGNRNLIRRSATAYCLEKSFAIISSSI